MISAQDWHDLSTRIVAAVNDQATLTGLMSEAGDKVAELMAAYNVTQSDNEKLLKDNESLRKSNMDLFLRVGESQGFSSSKQEEVKEDITIDKFLEGLKNG